MIVKGLDVGNSFTKDNEGRIFKSAFAYRDTTMSDASNIIIDGKKYYFGIGNSTVNVDRTDLEVNKVCTLSNLAMTGVNEYCLVVGVPIIQYKEKKDKLKETILQYNKSEVIYQDKRFNFRILEVDVCAQGLGALYSMSEDTKDRILFDIGSYTINVALIEFEDNKPKITKHDTWYSGVLNLYQGIINEVNRRFDLTLEDRYAQKILKDGLEIDGVKQNTEFLKPIIADYLEPIFTQFNLNYPHKTVTTLMLGGGSILLSETFRKRFKNSILLPDSQFTNARGYYNFGLQKVIKNKSMQNNLRR